MSASGNVPKRGSRVTSVPRPPSRIAIAWDMLKRADVLTRLGMCVVATLAIWLITRGWQSPFAFRQGDVPARSITARVFFQTLNQEETDLARDKARRRVFTIYRHEQAPLYQLREALVDKVHQVRRAGSWEKLSAEEEEVWKEFMQKIPNAADDNPENTKTPADRLIADKNSWPATFELPSKGKL